MMTVAAGFAQWGEAQSAVIMAVYDELKSRGINVVHSTTDETSIDLGITSYNALTSEVKDAVTRIDVRTMRCSAWIFWNLIDSHYGTGRGG